MSITPKDWARFQHYKNRAPSWIKFHRSLLDNYDYARLPVASRALAPMLWLLASEYDDGKITATVEEIAFRLRTSVAELTEALTPYPREYLGAIIRGRGSPTVEDLRARGEAW
jgi:hypothetical protein